MSTNRISFKFEGGLADRHLLDASDGVTFETAARQLLATQAYYFVHESVPNGGAINHTYEYRVYQAGRANGSIIYDYVLEFFGKFNDEIMKELAHELVGFMLASLRHALKRRSAPPAPLWPVAQSELRAVDGNREPLVDREADREYHWQQYAERQTSVLVDVLRPLDRSATTLSIFCDGNHLVKLGIDDLRRLQVMRREDQEARMVRERQIVDALNHLRRH